MKKILTNSKGLFVREIFTNSIPNAPQRPEPVIPFETIEVEVSDEVAASAREILKSGGLPVLIDGAFVDKKEEKEQYIVKVLPKFAIVYPNNAIGGLFISKPDETKLSNGVRVEEINEEQFNQINAARQNKKTPVLTNGQITER